MRHVFDPILGSDVSTTVQAALQAGQELVTAFLYSWRFGLFWDYNPYNSYCTYTFTDAAFPIYVNKMQQSAVGAVQIGPYSHGSVDPIGLTFQPENFTLNELNYDVGFADHPVEVTWGINDSIDYGVLINTVLGGTYLTYPSNAMLPAGLTLKQAFALGAFSECDFWIHQAIFSDFPANGGTFYGTTLMHRGMIKSVKITSSLIKFEISSLMRVFQETSIPTQTITPNNRSLPYLPFAASPYGGDWALNSSPNPLTLVFNTSESINTGALQDSYISFNPAGYAGFNGYFSGMSPQPVFKIQGNDASTGSTVNVYFYTPPIVPGVIGGYNLFSQQPLTGVAAGFENVPMPESAP